MNNKRNRRTLSVEHMEERVVLSTSSVFEPPVELFAEVGGASTAGALRVHQCPKQDLSQV